MYSKENAMLSAEQNVHISMTEKEWVLLTFRKLTAG